MNNGRKLRGWVKIAIAVLCIAIIGGIAFGTIKFINRNNEPGTDPFSQNETTVSTKDTEKSNEKF